MNEGIVGTGGGNRVSTDTPATDPDAEAHEPEEGQAAWTPDEDELDLSPVDFEFHGFDWEEGDAW